MSLMFVQEELIVYLANVDDISGGKFLSIN